MNEPHPTLPFRVYPLLIVDDDPNRLIVLSHAASAHDAHVESSFDGALGMLEKNRYRVVLSSIGEAAPETGAGGVAICEKARRDNPCSERILVAFGEDAMSRAMDAVRRRIATRFVEPPIREAELRQLLRSALDAVHTRETVDELRSRLLAIGFEAEGRVGLDDVKRRLDPPTRSLQHRVAHAADLVRLCRDSDSDRRRRTLLDELEAVMADAAHAVDDLHALRDELERGVRPAPPAIVEVGRIVADAVNILRPRVGDAKIVLALGDPPPARMTPSSLAQIVTSLVLNAVEATAGLTDREICVEVDRDGDHDVVVKVHDNGPGVDPTLRDRIFDPQVTTRPGAAGIGLAVARHLTEAGGGTLTLEPSDQGALFVARFPLAVS